jgi:hypothetical protein
MKLNLENFRRTRININKIYNRSIKTCLSLLYQQSHKQIKYTLKRPNSLKRLMNMPQHVPVLVPLRRRRIDKMRIQLIIGTSDGDQTMCSNPINLVHIINLSTLVLPLLGCHPVGARYQVLQIHVRQCQVVQHGVLRRQLTKPSKESKVLSL